MRDRGSTRLGAAAAVLVAVLMACSATGASPTPQSTGPRDPSAERPTARAERSPAGRTERAVVVSITDGDTIRVDRGFGSERVRYIGVNTPEVADPFGSAATAANARLVEGREVVLERDVSEADRFGRLLRYVWLEDDGEWLFVNLALVEQGFAQVATYPPDVRYADLYLAAQTEARTAGAGLWTEAAASPTLAPAAPTVSPPAGDCHPSYDPCLPIVGDLSCPEVRALGLAPVRVLGNDPYRLDGNHDGIGCE